VYADRTRGPFGPSHHPAPLIIENAPQGGKKPFFRLGRCALMGAALLLAVGTSGTFGYRW
jgi:hypothetical protein